MTASGAAARFKRLFGVPWVNTGGARLSALVGLVGDIGEVDRDPDEGVVIDFSIIRFRTTTTACSVEWRVEGTGDNPVLGEHFEGGDLPSGDADFGVGDTSIPASFVLAAGAPPPVVLSGRIVLENPITCEIASDRTEIEFTIAAAEIVEEDAIVGLDVDFTELDRDPTNPLVCAFDVVRSGDTAGTCSVQWRVEGTGSAPVVAADFQGGVLPSGTENFSAAELVETTSFSLAAGADPATRKTGRIVLHTPVDCKIDPAGELREFSLKPAAVSADTWDFAEARMAVHAGSDQLDRVTWHADGVEVAGSAGGDGSNIALWFKQLPPEHYEITFEYEKNEDDPAVDSNDRFAQIWPAYEGTAGGRPANVSTWTEAHYNPGGDYDPAEDKVYYDFGRGNRISFDVDSPNPESSDEARNRVANVGLGAVLDSTPADPAFVMADAGTKWRMVLRKRGEVQILSKTPGGEAIQWTDSGLAVNGRIGFRFGRGRGGILRHVSDADFMRELPPPDDGGGEPVEGNYYSSPRYTGLTAETVSNHTELMNAISGVNPSNAYIRMTYVDNTATTINRNATSSRPLIITADAPQGLGNFTGRPGFTAGVTLDGEGIWLDRLAIKRSGTDPAISLRKKWKFITRCYVEAGQGVSIRENVSADEWWIGFNRFGGSPGEGRGHQGNIHIDARASASGRPKNGRIYYNTFLESPNGPSQESYCIMTGPGSEVGGEDQEYPGANVDGSWVHYNYITTNRNYAIYLK
ncbi:MAG: alkaline phosphatase, partial [Thermomicrobiales bacterium]|nr:alkaline phosphatase [Thermomicrobiales bacterium]